MSATITKAQKEKITHGAAFVAVAGLCFEAAFWDRTMQLMVFPLFAALGLALRKPRDGRLFWIANEAPDTLRGNVRFGTWLALFFFLYFAVGFVWVIS